MRSRRLVRTSQSALVDEGHAAHGGVYILRGEQLSAEDRTLLQAAARAVLLSRRGTLADQVIRLERPDRIVPSVPSRAGAGAAGADGGRRIAAAGARVLQRPGWLRRRRAGVRRRPGAGSIDSRALAERDRQSVVRLPGLRVRLRLQLVREQPGEPAHPVVERPGQRPDRRGDLRSRR